MSIKGFYSFAKCTAEKREPILDRIITEFMFVPVFVIALWLVAFGCDCVCRACYNSNEMVYVCESEAVQLQTDEVLAVVDTGCGVLVDGKLDINSASIEEFQRLDGIGLAKAQNIVDTRNKLGGFRSVDDLLNVDGIGEKILESIRNSVTIEK